jgi:rod shape determining protein RodA
MNLKDTFFRKFDWLLFAPAAILCAIGLVAIYSTDLGQAGGDFANFKKQLVAFLLGLLLLFAAAFFDYRQARSAKNFLYFAGAGVLLAVLIFGATIRGTRGWFVLGPLSFQPVEVAKIILVIFLAEYFSREGRRLHTLGSVAKSFIAAAIFIGLVMSQPDLGSSIILFLSWFGILALSRVKRWHFLIVFILLLAVAIAAWFFVLEPYQKERIAVFVNPELDPLGSGYNIKQSIIAIGSGGLWGKGVGFGSQSQLRFLPESNTDFIFALVAEEMGFFIVAVMLFLYGLFFWRIFKIMRESRDDFTAYLAAGFLIIFISETVINIGMNLGLAPITGLALPFVSSGGSSLLSKLLMVGILESAELRE